MMKTEKYMHVPYGKTVHGEEEIEEQVLINLINSKEIQRLKNISQYGMPKKYYHKIPFSRYDHSIGVLILLRRMKANLNEQIAGLLHDVSHTAFSHVVDWVIGDSTKEDYQDNIHLGIIENSEIPEILNKYGIDYKNISNIEEYSLLEQEIPMLCADRVDYALREMKLSRNLDIDKIINCLISYEGKIVFSSIDSAKIFANEFVKCQKEH